MTRGDEAISKSRLLSSDKGTDRSIIISTFQQKLFFFYFLSSDGTRSDVAEGERMGNFFLPRGASVRLEWPVTFRVCCVCFVFAL